MVEISALDHRRGSVFPQSIPGLFRKSDMMGIIPHYKWKLIKRHFLIDRYRIFVRRHSAEAIKICSPSDVVAPTEQVIAVQILSISASRCEVYDMRQIVIFFPHVFP
jgi:hypothetical protein